MKASKVTVTITVEALSIDCLRGLLSEAADRVGNEFENGELVASDGDVMCTAGIAMGLTKPPRSVWQMRSRNTQNAAHITQ